MDPRDLRVSDQERELTAAALRTHFAVGRLDAEELDERLSAVYAARTGRELDATLAQLPDLPPSIVEQRLALTERRRVLRGRALQEVGGGIGTGVLTIAVWAVTGRGYFWPIWVFIAMLIPLVKGGWDLYSPWGDLDRLEGEFDKKARSGNPLRELPNPAAGDARPVDPPEVA